MVTCMKERVRVIFSGLELEHTADHKALQDGPPQHLEIPSSLGIGAFYGTEGPNGIGEEALYCPPG